MASLDKNPEKNGTPEIAKVAMAIVQYVIGILDLNPPIFRIS